MGHIDSSSSFFVEILIVDGCDKRDVRSEMIGSQSVALQAELEVRWMKFKINSKNNLLRIGIETFWNWIEPLIMDDDDY